MEASKSSNLSKDSVSHNRKGKIPKRFNPSITEQKINKFKKKHAIDSIHISSYDVYRYTKTRSNKKETKIRTKDYDNKFYSLNHQDSCKRSSVI